MMKEKQYPTKSDVRRMLLDVSELLDRYGTHDDYDTEIVPFTDFDLSFLRRVRDVMRDGADFAEALTIVALVDEGEI